MAFRLAAADRERLDALYCALLSPLHQVEPTAWARLVEQRLRVLFGADTACLLLPTPAGPTYFSETLSEAALAAYRDYYRKLDVGWWVRRPALGLEVAACADLWRPRELRYSEFYQDFLLPQRLHHIIGITVGQQPRAAGLAVQRARANDRPFGARGLNLLRLILPVFRAGTRIFRHLQDAGAAHRHTVPGSRRRSLVSDPLSDVAPLNAPLRPLLEAERGHGLVLALPALPRHFAGGWSAAPRNLRSVGRAPATANAVFERSGLTCREREVACLLVQGYSNEALARRLSISPHTARHHTESVLLKLGVRSRAQVASAVLAGSR